MVNRSDKKKKKKEKKPQPIILKISTPFFKTGGKNRQNIPENLKSGIRPEVKLALVCIAQDKRHRRDAARVWDDRRLTGTSVTGETRPSLSLLSHNNRGSPPKHFSLIDSRGGDPTSEPERIMYCLIKRPESSNQSWKRVIQCLNWNISVQESWNWIWFEVNRLINYSNAWQWISCTYYSWLRSEHRTLTTFWISLVFYYSQMSIVFPFFNRSKNKSFYTL